MKLTRLQVCRLIGIIAMAIWGTVLILFNATGRIDAYLKPEYLKVLSLVGGFGILGLAVFNLYHLRTDEGAACSHDHDHDHDHDHHHDHGHDPHHDHHHEHDPHHEHGHDDDEEHGHHEDISISGNLAMFIVMVVPLVVAASYSQDRYLSATTIRNKGRVEDTQAVASRVKDTLPTPPQGEAAGEPGSAGGEDWEYTIEDLEKVVDRSETGHLLLTVDQLFYTSGDEELQNVLEGEPVETTGQVIPEDGFNPHQRRLRLFTLMVTCCAADAQPVSIPIEFADGLPEYKEMGWFKVSGIVKYPTENGRKTSVIHVTRIEPAEEPLNDMLF